MRVFFSSLIGLVALGVSASAQGPGTGIDIGQPNVTGSSNVKNGVYTLAAGGADIWGLSDQFRYHYWPLSSEGMITVRLTSLGNTDPYAKAGLMIREGTNSPGARFIDLVVRPNGQVSFQYRRGFLANSEPQYAYTPGYTGASEYPVWLRLAFTQGRFVAYTSADGTAFQEVGSILAGDIAAGVALKNLSIGLALCSHNQDELSTAVFDNLSVITPPGSRPDFAIYSNPGTTYLRSGLATRDWSDVQIIPFNGFSVQNRNASISVLGSVPGIESHVNYPGQFAFSSQSSAKPGIYGYTVSMTIGGITHTAPTRLAVLPNVPPVPGGTDVHIGLNSSGGYLYTQPYNKGGYFGYTMYGDGLDVWGTADSFAFHYFTVIGDGSITVRLNGLSRGSTGTFNPNPAPDLFAKAGVMYRTTLDPNSSYAFAFYSPAGQALQHRPSAGEEASGSPYIGAQLPYWLRLVRSGNTFTAFGSEDGANFTQLGDPVMLADARPAMYVGIAACSHSADNPINASYDSMTVTSAP